jgi:hypothetical protein
MTVHRFHVSAVAGQAASARAAVEAASAVPMESLGCVELGGAVAELAALESQAATLKLRTLTEADAHRVAK